MNLKKSYHEEPGYKKVITSRNSPLTYAEMDMLVLSKGEKFVIDEVDKEFVSLVMYGQVNVCGEGFCFEKVGKRASTMEVVGAENVYVGKNTPFTIECVSEKAKVAIAKAPAPKYFAPQCVRAEDMKLATFGKETFVRDVAFTFPETMQSNYLYIGEYWVENGFWASFPPHKHDVENGKEGALDEIYYYEFDKPQGFGIQMVYTDDKTINEAYKIETGDAVEIPVGYHPMAVAPGYRNYTLWIMAGPRRGLLSSGEPCHQWIVK
ncbi:MAG: 5-deoxy-glucuronate isomerase [Bacilli bacterium]|nr:5-deoxy-glucuronate isomerase [Bacilli bacterium]